MTSEEQIRSARPETREPREGDRRPGPSYPDSRRRGNDSTSSALPVKAPRAIELHIEELVLNGFESSSRYQIADTIERELTRLLTEHGAPDAFSEDLAIDRLDCGTLELKPGASAKATARQLAIAIHRGLNR